MSIKEILQDYALQELEEQIIMSYDGPFSKLHDYTNERCLLEVRRHIINHQVLRHQEVLLPDIIAFNDVLREALLKMYEHPKGDQSWVFIGRTDVEAETPILWPLHAKS